MISIALCTYNGEKYLQEQLGSIEQQTMVPDELVVCDDRSSDSTMEILGSFKERVSFPVHIHQNETNLGALKNFEKAINLCQGKWISLCDQDDSWLPNKLEILSRKMEQMEAAVGESTPILIHTDAIVGDESLNKIANSLWEFQGTYPQKGHSLSRLLSQNVVTGCTALFNRALWSRAFPIPEKAVIHDWWLALVASAFGKMGHVPESTIIYRQSGRNVIGAKKWTFLIALRLLFDLKSRGSVIKDNKEISNRIRNQAQEFLHCYNDDLSEIQKNTLSAFIALPGYSYFKRKYLIIRYGLHYHGLLRNVGHLILK